MQQSQQSVTQAIRGDPLDETGLCLLSLDGGGVRGLSTLLILKRLIDRTNIERDAHGLRPMKPCELFDLIGGTSTGGLIAIMLGRLRMSIDECITAYTSMFEKIFERRKHRLPINLWENFGKLQERFDSDILRDLIKEVVEHQGLLETDLFNAEGSRTCRVFVCATAVENTTTVPIRDYNLLDESNHDTATIVEAALATSAATTFFKPVTIGVRQYVDGALGSNNPIEYVWNEAQSIWCPDHGQLEPIVKCFVSVGTGNPGSTPIRDGAKDFLTQTLKDIATETGRTAAKSAARHRGLLDKKRYFRYNVEQGLQAVGLEEYRKQPDIEAATHTYLADQTQKFSLRDCAKNLGIKQSSTPLDFNQRMVIYIDRLIAVKYASAVPKTHFLVPPPSFEEFAGREGYMSHLKELVCDPGKHTKVALYGLGGIGKTRIALEFAHKWKTSSSISVFWVHAGTAQRMENGYLDIAKEVSIAGWDSPDPKIDKLRLVKDWLEGKTSGQWILVLDNADDIELLYGGPSYSSRLADYFPRSANGTIVLTTRNKKVGTKFTGIRNVLWVQALTTAESVRLLQTKLGNDFNKHEYSNLATMLDNVPLALVQAAAFIATESSSVSEYLHLYNQSERSRIQLLSDDFEEDIRDSDNKNPVAATFAISFEHISKSDPRAADLLSMMSMLDPQAIPASLLPVDEDLVLFTKALGTLQAFSLITKTSHQDEKIQLFDLHRLVCLAMHKWLDVSSELELWTAKAISIMSERFPRESHKDRDICRIYLPHALAILSCNRTLDSLISSETIQSTQEALSQIQIAQATLQLNVSRYLQAKGDYTSAKPIAQRSLALREKVLGKEHPATLASMNNLGLVLESQGEYEEAKKMHWRTLQLSEKVLGKEHLDTLTSMNNLGLVLNRQGKYEEAEKMHRQTLQLREKVLGKEHPYTLMSMESLIAVLKFRASTRRPRR